jgi:hypothetical protein
VAGQQLADRRGRDTGAGMEDDPGRRSPSCRHTLEAARLDFRLPSRELGFELQTLFEVEIFESGSAAAKLAAALRKSVEPSRVQRGLGFR